MKNSRRRCSRSLIIILFAVLWTHCAAPDAVVTQSDFPEQRPVAESQPARRHPSTPSVSSDRAEAAVRDEAGKPAREELGEPTYTIEYRFRPGAVTYYIIENEFRDDRAIPGWLSSTTTVTDRRFIIRRVEPMEPGGVGGAKDEGAGTISWECDRYEVREVGMALNQRNETTFDSLRDSHPPPSLRELGKIPGSRSTFSLEPSTGQASQIKIVPGPVGGPVGRKKQSGTAKKCLLSQKTLGDLLFDIGPFYLPGEPKRVGEQWQKTHQRNRETFGMVTTELTCTLNAVREVEGRKIADISFEGQVTLPPKRASASQPAGAGTRRHRPPRAKHQDFKVQRALCTGSVEFDLTRGELISMTLRRELECTTDLRKDKNKEPDPMVPTEIRAGNVHVLRVEVRQTPPPKPVIVGGPKPPAGTPDHAKSLKPTARRPHSTTQPLASRRARTQPARPGKPRVVGETNPSLARPNAAQRRQPTGRRRAVKPTTRQTRRGKPNAAADRQQRKRARGRRATTRPAVKKLSPPADPDSNRPIPNHGSSAHPGTSHGD